MGYHRAGFEVVGVDINPQPRYPFEFIQSDALKFLNNHLTLERHNLAIQERFDVIHASPPCQRYARIGAVHGVRGNHPDLIDATRALLIESGYAWVIENVPDSKIPGVTLCGSMFGLKATGALDGIERQLRRHRLFESNVPLLVPRCQHRGEPIGVYGNGGPQRDSRNRGYMGGKKERLDAMGITWMDVRELSNAIPPAYTEFIGAALMSSLRPRSAQQSCPAGPAALPPGSPSVPARPSRGRP